MSFKIFVASLALLTALSALPLGSFFITSTAFAAAVAWDGGGDGSSWSDADNWNNDTLPGSSDDVIIDDDVTVILASGTTVNSLTLGNSSGTTAPTLRFSYDALGGSDPLVIDGGDLTVYTNADVDHSPGTSSVVGTVAIEVASGDADVSGTINVSSLGYENGGPCQGDPVFGSGQGGAYGGFSGIARHSTNWGIVADVRCTYGSITEPTHYGSSGENSVGDGGGAAYLSVDGTLTLDGSITANGSQGSNTAGSGSGGSIWVEADTITGSGSMSANGGNTGPSSNVSAGSGGRVAVYYDTSNAITPTAYGGDAWSGWRNGGAGTVYLHHTTDTYGDLLIDNNNLASDFDVWHGTTPATSTAYTFDEVTIQNGGNFEIESGSSVTYSSLDWDTGIVTDNGGTFDLVSTSTNDLVIPADARLYANTARTFNSVTVNGVLDHSTNRNESSPMRIDLTITDDFTVASGGSVNANAAGFISRYGTGQGIDGGSYGSGAGHGDVGGDATGSTGSGGTDYGDEDAPVTLGSGGGKSHNQQRGGTGGGAVELNVGGDLYLYGDITADAGSDETAYSGGGSGGSVWLAVDGFIYGTGDVSANGGDAASSPAGAGAGGRVRYECLASSWSGAVTVDAGVTGQTAGDGSITEDCIATLPPTGTFNSATQVTDGSGNVTLSIEVDDPDDDDTMAKIEYETDEDGSCDGPWSAATLTGTATADFNDSSGAPDINNTNTYQVGSGTDTRIITSSGSNTVEVTWDSASDVPSTDDTHCLRLTVNDDIIDQVTPDTITVGVDTEPPTPISAEMLDTDSDGTIDRVDILFNDTLTLGAYATADWSFPDAGDMNLNDTGASVLTDTIQMSVSADANETGGLTLAQVLYTNNADALTDANGNPVETFSAAMTVEDAALPLILLTDPVDGGTHPRRDRMEVTFTEPMDTSSVSYTLTDAPGGPVRTYFTSTDTVYNINYRRRMSLSEHTLTITQAEDKAGNAFAGGTVAGVVHPVDFTAVP